jgi:glycosyltransferase involved in cell wall biosynthesis
LIIKGFKSILIEFPDTRLVIVGRGPSENELLSLTKELGIEDNVEFAGFQSDVKPYLDKAQYFIMTSRSEGLPCAIMEAMSNGNIILTTPVGNIPDLVIDNQTGFLIDGDTPLEVEKAMRRSLNLRDQERKEYIDRGRDFIVNHHSFRSAQEKWRNVFDTLSIRDA